MGCGRADEETCDQHVVVRGEVSWVSDADCFKEVSITAKDVVTAGAEDSIAAELPPRLLVQEGLSLFEVVEHVFQPVSGHCGCRLLVAMGL